MVGSTCCGRQDNSNQGSVLHQYKLDMYSPLSISSQRLASSLLYPVLAPLEQLPPHFTDPGAGSL